MERKDPERMTLTALRLRRGLTQKQAADYLRISVGTLSNYERGKYRPNADVIRRMEIVYATSFSNMVFAADKDGAVCYNQEAKGGWFHERYAESR